MLPKPIICFLLLFSNYLSFAQSLPSNVSDYDTDLLNAKIIERVNALRAKKGISPLRNDASLKSAAKHHSLWMAEKDKLTHFENKASYKTPSNRITHYGGSYAETGENVQFFTLQGPHKLKGEKEATTCDSYERLAEVLVYNWRHSPPHYANMMHPGYEVSYVDVAIGKDGKLYATQLFGSNPYDPPGTIPPQPNFLPYKKRKCRRCNRGKPLGKTSATGIHVRNDSIFFYSDKVRQFKKSVRGKHGAIAADIVLKDQFPCGEGNKINGLPGVTGFLLSPVYKPYSKEHNLIRRRHGMLVYLGQVPEEIKQEYEINLSLINKRRSCLNIVFHHLPTASLQQLDIKPKYDLLPPPSHFRHKDSMLLTVHFNKSGTEGFQAELETLKDSLLSNGSKIVDAKLIVSASIEGPTEINAQLLEDRSNTIIELLKEVSADTIAMDIKLLENFARLKGDVKDTDFHWMRALDSTQLKDTINSNPELRQDLEPYLSKHRFASMKLKTVWETPIKYTPQKAINYFLWSEKTQDKKRYQSKIFEYIRNDSLKIDSVSNLFQLNYKADIPFYHNFILLKWELDSLNPERETLALAQYDSLRSVEPNKKLYNDNYLILYMKDAANFIRFKNKKDIVDPSEHINSVKKASPKIKKKLLLNASLYKAAVYHYLEKNALLQQELNTLLNLAKKTRITTAEAYAIATEFSFFLHFDKAIEVMEKYKIGKNGNAEEMAFLIKLYILRNNDKDQKKLAKVIDNLSRKSKETFCESFHSPVLNFQVLDNAFIKAKYCEKCNE